MTREKLKSDFNDEQPVHHIEIYYIKSTKIPMDQRLNHSWGTGAEV